MDFDREATLYVARLAQQADRYDDVAESMRNLAKTVADLTEDERKLLMEAHKKAINTRRASWGVLSRLLGKEMDATNNNRITEYRKKVEKEITDICKEILFVLDEHLIPSIKPDSHITTVFYFKMKADFSRYLAQFIPEDDKEEVSEDSLEAYEIASGRAREWFEPTDPIRMGVALNYSVFYYTIQHNIDRACEIAKEAYREARDELHRLHDEEYKNCVRVLKRLNENLNQWNAVNFEDDTDTDTATI